jgi:polysaccharide deacetylase 2 family uncharacterized protein YibQ
MKKLFSFLFNFITQPIKRIRLRYFLYLLIAALVYLIGKSYWEGSNVTKDPSTQAQIAPTPQKKIHDTLETKIVEKESRDADGEDEEDAGENDDNASESKSPWSLLQTALPPSYFKPSVKTESPCVAIIVTGLGLNETLTEKATTALSPKITLAFSPYSQKIAEKLQKATKLGHQTLISLPLEPNSYPNPDPGPYTLLTGVNPIENIIKIKEVLKTTPKGTGVLGDYGSRFLISESDLEPVLKEIKDHAAIFIDPNTTIHSQVQKTCKKLNMSCHRIDFTLPHNSSLSQRNDFLKIMIQNAKENGIIIISVPAVPAFIEHLLEWEEIFKASGIKLVSVNEIEAFYLSLEALGKKEDGKPNDNGQISHQPR